MAMEQRSLPMLLTSAKAAGQGGHYMSCCGEYSIFLHCGEALSFGESGGQS